MCWFFLLSNQISPSITKLDILLFIHLIMINFSCPRCQDEVTPVMNGKTRLVISINCGVVNPSPITVPFHIFVCKRCDTRFGVECADLPKSIPDK